jgi:hypothetical protein
VSYMKDPCVCTAGVGSFAAGAVGGMGGEIMGDVIYESGK